MNYIYSMKISTVLSHSNAFDTKTKSITEIINQLPKIKSLIIISEYNAKIFRLENDQSLQIEILNQWKKSLSLRTNYKLNAYLSQIIRTKSSFVFFNNLSSLLLINQILQSNNYETRDLNDTEIELLFEAYLLCTEMWSHKQLNHIKDEQDINKKIQNFIISNVSLGEFLRTNYFHLKIIKSIYLFKFLSNDKNKIILSDFLKLYECESWQEYLKRTLVPIISLTMPDSPSKSKLSTKNTPIQFNNFLDKLCINNYTQDINTAFNFITLRNYPFYKIDEHTYLVMNYHFAFEKMFEAMVFNISEVATKRNNYKHVRDARKEIFSQNFYEGYFIKKICDKFKSFNWIKIEYIFENNLKGNHQSPDIIITCPKCVFIIEFKDTLLNDTDKLSFNPEKIEEAILKKLWMNDEGRYRGAGQIVSYLNNTTHNRYKKKKIYPLIIVTDRNYCRDGTNLLLNNLFINELNEETKKVSQSLTLIHLDTILEIIDLLLHNPSFLKNTIDEYHKLIRNEKILVKKLMNFDDFVEKKIRTNNNLSLLKNTFIDIIEDFDSYKM
jgi:hypothetical protein